MKPCHTSTGQEIYLSRVDKFTFIVQINELLRPFWDRK